ncbi:MAG: cell division protein SepF [Clostridiales bacterium]|jgi:cell division inhibitor SepF|nr:cell division protein SepF [Clostridiales bacterium]
MIKKFFRNVMLGTEYDDEIYEGYAEGEKLEEDVKHEESTRLEAVRGRKSEDKSKIINFRSGAQMQVMLTYPKKVEEVTDICDYLVDGTICVVNLEGVDRAISQRIADFLGGAIYAIEGEIEPINNYIFVVAPSTVRISKDTGEELQASNILPWIASSFK